jgi:hypothetical protein
MQRCGPVKISSSKLTTCNVANDGSKVCLEFLDQSGQSVAVEMPFEQAEAVVMTLPRLLASAVRQKTGNQEARYVFGLHGWAIEGVKDQQCLIATGASSAPSASRCRFQPNTRPTSKGMPKQTSKPSIVFKHWQRCTSSACCWKFSRACTFASPRFYGIIRYIHKNITRQVGSVGCGVARGFEC